MKTKKNNTASGVGAKLGSRSRLSQGDVRTRANVKLARLLREKIAEASLGDSEMVSSVAVDLADIAAIGEKHRGRLRDLLRLHFPQDLDKLEDLLVGFDVDLLWENQWHLRSLKRKLPRLLANLNQRIRGDERSEARKPESQAKPVQKGANGRKSAG